MMAAPIAADWSNFLVAEAGASAALAGLIFVAVSINISKIIEYPGVSGRAGEALALLIGVLIIATLGLAPLAAVLGARLHELFESGRRFAAGATAAWLSALARPDPPKKPSSRVNNSAGSTLT